MPTEERLGEGIPQKESRKIDLYTAVTQTGTSADELSGLISLCEDVNAIYPERGCKGGLLHAAVFAGNVVACEALLQAGADVNLRIPSGSWVGASAVFLAAKANNTDVVKLLVKAGAHVTDVDRVKREAVTERHLQAREDGNTEVTGETFSEFCTLQFCDSVIPALENENAEMLQCLIDAGADPNGPVAMCGPGQPILAAAKFNRKSCVEVLIKAGAEVNVKLNGDETPLTEAARLGYIDVCEMLIEAGADVSVTGKWSKNLLELADEPRLSGGKPPDMRARVEALVTERDRRASSAGRGWRSWWPFSAACIWNNAESRSRMYEKK